MWILLAYRDPPPLYQDESLRYTEIGSRISFSIEWSTCAQTDIVYKSNWIRLLLSFLSRGPLLTWSQIPVADGARRWKISFRRKEKNLIEPTVDIQRQRGCSPFAQSQGRTMSITEAPTLFLLLLQLDPFHLVYGPSSFFDPLVPPYQHYFVWGRVKPKQNTNGHFFLLLLGWWSAFNTKNSLKMLPLDIRAESFL